MAFEFFFHFIYLQKLYVFPQRGENSMVYSVATFTIKKSGKLVRRNEKAEEEATVYSDISASAVK